jgi:hypothetical protein
MATPQPIVGSGGAIGGLNSAQSAPQSNPYGSSGQGPSSNPYTPGSQQWYIYSDFSKNYGYNPTNAEVSAMVPAWSNAGGSAGAIANYMLSLQQQQTALQNSPQVLYQQQQQQYAQQAGNYSNQIGQAFQLTLGRAPTQAEQQYYGSLMASGQDQYQGQQALQQTQEYQNVQNTNFQNQLQQQLQQSNSTYFNQYIAPSLQAQNALSGQAPGSTALSSQLANAALQQNQGLQSFLAGVTAQNYQNSTANASNQYNQLMNQQYGLQNAGVSNALGAYANTSQQQNAQNLYQQQQAAYNQYLQQYGKRSGNQGIGSVAGGIAGAGLGGYFGGPKGALTGYQVGSSAGGGIGALL